MNSFVRFPVATAVFCIKRCFNGLRAWNLQTNSRLKEKLSNTILQIPAAPPPPLSVDFLLKQFACPSFYGKLAILTPDKINQELKWCFCIKKGQKGPNRAWNWLKLATNSVLAPKILFFLQEVIFAELGVPYVPNVPWEVEGVFILVNLKCKNSWIPITQTPLLKVVFTLIIYSTRLSMPRSFHGLKRVGMKPASTDKHFENINKW